MALTRYRAVLALPGVRALLLVAMLARLPATSMAVVLTLHVALTLERGYAAAGLLVAAITAGAAFGNPLLGRITDRYGLRRMLLLSTSVQVSAWLAAPFVPYGALVAGGFLAGLLPLPVFGVVRQALAAMVPVSFRRTAYSLDSMSVEVAYALGPALSVVLATQVSTRAAMIGIALALLVSAVLLYLLNPPTREGAGQETEPVPRRSWLTAPLGAVLLGTAGALVVLAGTDVAIVAFLEQKGEVRWAGLAIAAWCVWSLIGGFVHGAVPRSLSLSTLMLTLCLFTIPVGLAENWWMLCLVLIPAGALCAPTVAASSETVSQLVPGSVRGTAMGLHASAMTVGAALGAPLVGVAVDWTGEAAWGFAAAGLGGLVFILAAVAYRRWGPAQPFRQAPAPLDGEPANP
ncbi:MFS transporter [Longimycelium tulufanense]|uniref:MFS transporter n=1 Tax=Longimycelium tulufanense TaxID=907463 RepID=A0A8J3FX89_9PSEU|nr:MFS transporter [Longimycelium tulufanense]GGM77546.1 MFS transporter [Longimycelium tulufanense]